MSQLMLVNPRKRKARRSPAQRAATRKLIAANKRRRNPGPARKRRRNPARKANPWKGHRRAHATAARKGWRKRRRNPSARGIVNTTLIPALTAGAGAIGFTLLWGTAQRFVPLPAMLQTGIGSHLTKAAAAIGMGMLLKPVAGRKMSTELAAGALTVIAYEALKETLTPVIPGIAGIDGLGYYSAGQVGPGMGEYVGSGLPVGMGEYVGGGLPGGNYLGTPLAAPFQTPAPVAVPAATAQDSNMGENSAYWF